MEKTYQTPQYSPATLREIQARAHELRAQALFHGLSAIRTFIAEKWRLIAAKSNHQSA